MTTAIMWFRRDLRLGDNPALLAALQAADDVVPVFVFDDVIRAPAGPPRLAFLYRSLRSLDASMGGRLVTRTGNPVEVLPALAAEVGASAVFATGDFAPYGHRRDTAVADALSATGAELRPVESPYLVTPGSILKTDGTPFRVFSPFYRAWSRFPRPASQPAPTEPRWAEGVEGEGVPDDPEVAAALPPAGEEAAQTYLTDFVDRALGRYHEARDLPGEPGTSQLSVYLKYGCIHPRQLLDGLDPAEGSGEGPEKYRQEVAWRDFYADVLFHEPESYREPLQPQMARMRFDEGPEADARFAAWGEGRTGYPIVDAGMRQLQTEAWVHNRVRMIVASFLVKDLHIHWFRGCRFFMKHLRDGDLASNNHGWQWVAGTGTDPAPFFRIFNPVTQGRKFDPDGEYIRRYVPELAGLAPGDVHEPWKAGGVPGYPPPIVDHGAERAEALRRFAEVRSPS